MDSYESQVKQKYDDRAELSDNINISLLKYLWQVGPSALGSKGSIPQFLRKHVLFKNFSDIEIYTLSKYLHSRHFSDAEEVFSQGDLGFGFYIIYTGVVDIWVKEPPAHNNENEKTSLVTSLGTADFFGELALLQNNNYRTASARTRGHCQLLGLFRPDLEALMIDGTVVATKLIQSLAQIISNRFVSLTQDYQILNKKYQQMEAKNGIEKL